MTPLALADLETLREGWDFEAKLAAGQHGKGAIPKSFWETYSAMANTEGGAILLGARERGDHSIDLVGLTDPHKLETELWTALNNPQRASDCVLRREDVSTVKNGTATGLLIQVPKAQRHQRPVYIRGNVETGTYIRIHEGDHKVSPEQARRMLADRIDKRDETLLEHYALEDFDPDSLARYRNAFASRKGAQHPFATADDQEFLRSVRAWGRDRDRGVEGMTLAGLLMLGRENSIRDRFPHWHLSYKEIDASNDRWSDRVNTDGSWPGNLFSFYQRIIPKLTAGVKVPFAMGPGGHRNDESPVHIALREALVNTLIHADYAGPGGIRIIRRPHEFEFVNPGLPLISVERLWEGGASVPRNPTLQHLFAMVNLGEREGSGGPAILKAWQSQQWKLPLIRQDFELQETHLALRQVSLLPAESLQALSAEWGERFTALDELGRLAVTTAHSEDGVITHQRLRELTDDHSRAITLGLQKLVKAGFFESSGGGPGTKYHLRNRDQSQGSLPLWPSSPESSPHKNPSSTHETASSTHKSPSSTHRTTSSTQSEALIARVAASARAPRSDVQSALLAFCREFRTIPEIAAALGREERSIRQNYIRDMVRDGLLSPRHPERRTHPKQAYRATDQDDPTA